MGLNVVILAAGHGSRMQSNSPKVLHKLGGKPMLERVINTVSKLKPKNIYVVYGYGGDAVKQAMQHLDVTWVYQKKQKGTGHAVAQALPDMSDDDRVLIIPGDVPLITTSTLLEIIQDTPPNALGIVITTLENPAGFGRMVRSTTGNIIAIVEHKDATKQQLAIKEINTGIMVGSVEHFRQWLPRLTSGNVQGELYLTDVVDLAVSDGFYVSAVEAHSQGEVRGVNDRWQLAKLEYYFQREQAKELALSGVNIMDYHRLTIRGDAEVAVDTILDVNVVMEGNVKIGTGSIIGPNVFLKDCIIGDNCKVLANSVIEGATIADDVQIGPFARIRPETYLATKVKIGNFVEIKKSTIGKATKVSHLTYIGDAQLGEQVNIGAGTITCNYDGAVKSETHIEDQAFIGSNTALVAPVTIGKAATVGAGSVITKDVEAGSLAIERTQQTSVANYSLKKKQTKT